MKHFILNYVYYVHLLCLSIIIGKLSPFPVLSKKKKRKKMKDNKEINQNINSVNVT